MARLTDLPEEIILQIHLLAVSPFLPLSHPAIYHTLHNSPRTYIARYLLRLYTAYGPSEILVRAVRHPICDVSVAREIARLWDRRRGYIEPELRKRKAKRSQQSSFFTSRDNMDTAAGDEEEEEKMPDPTAPPLSCSEIPRRLFRTTQPSDRPIPPLLEYILDTYTPSPNSHKGYPLCRAVLTANTRLIEFLLQHDADPSIQAALPVRIATQMGRLDLVKLLVEPYASGVEISDGQPGKKGLPGGAEEPLATPTATGKKSRMTPSPSNASAKRIKRGERVVIGPELVELAMKSGHEHIVRYFVHDKGVIPPLRSIMKMGKEPAMKSVRMKGITSRGKPQPITPVSAHKRRSTGSKL